MSKLIVGLAVLAAYIGLGTLLALASRRMMKGRSE